MEQQQADIKKLEALPSEEVILVELFLCWEYRMAEKDQTIPTTRSIYIEIFPAYVGSYCGKVCVPPLPCNENWWNLMGSPSLVVAPSLVEAYGIEKSLRVVENSEEWDVEMSHGNKWEATYFYPLAN